MQQHNLNQMNMSIILTNIIQIQLAILTTLVAIILISL